MREDTMDTEPIVDQQFMENFFRSHLELLGASELLGLKILRHDPTKVFDRRVVLVKYELAIRKPDGSVEELILRGSKGPDDKRIKAFHIMDNLARHGFLESAYSVPRPIGYFPEYGLLLYVNIPGTTMMVRMESGKDRLAEITRGAIEWLIQFNNKKPHGVLEAKFQWEKEREIFSRLVETVCNKYKTQCPRIQAAVEVLLRQEKELLDESQFTLVHGDFQPNNIILTERGVAVIDFNDAFFFDELYDLAYFVTQVRFMLQRFSRQTLDPLLASLVNHYCAARQIPEDETTEKKLALFTAKSLLSIKALTTHEQGEKILEEIETYAKKTI